MTEDFVLLFDLILEDRIEKLHDAAEEHDRLQAELRTLDAAPVALDAAPIRPISLDALPVALDAAPIRPISLDAAPVVLDAPPIALPPDQGVLDLGLVALGAAPDDGAAPNDAPLNDAAPAVPQTASPAAHPALDAEPRALEIDPGQLEIDPGPSEADPGPLTVDPGPSTVDPAVPEAVEAESTPDGNVVRLPVRPEPARPPAVSPKVARLMLAPRRPALERSGLARVSGRDTSPREAVDESEAQTGAYEHAV